jgi:hypothetical protein
MARTIRIGDIGNYANNQMEKLLRAAVLETDSLLKQASPVDLGRFRASWQVGENAAPGGIKPEGSYPKNVAIERVNYQRERAGNIYSVHNNLPYAEKLAIANPGSGSKKEERYNPRRTVKTWGTPGEGSSIQTNGPGWVQAIAKDVQGRVIAAAAKIGRES